MKGLVALVQTMPASDSETPSSIDGALASLVLQVVRVHLADARTPPIVSYRCSTSLIRVEPKSPLRALSLLCRIRTERANMGDVRGRLSQNHREKRIASVSVVQFFISTFTPPPLLLPHDERGRSFNSLPG